MSKELPLTSDTMWLRTLATRVIKENEVEVYTDSGETHVGYVTGLDEMWLQITTTGKRECVLISIQHIVTIKYPRSTLDKSGLSEQVKSSVRNYSYAFRKTAEEYLEENNNVGSEGRV